MDNGADVKCISIRDHLKEQDQSFCIVQKLYVGDEAQKNHGCLLNSLSARGILRKGTLKFERLPPNPYKLTRMYEKAMMFEIV